MTKDTAGFINGKTCSICGVWHDQVEYSYGRRNNRSYCRACDRQEKAAYARGGAAAATQFREEKRASWRHSSTDN